MAGERPRARQRARTRGAPRSLRRHRGIGPHDPARAKGGGRPGTDYPPAVSTSGSWSARSSYKALHLARGNQTRAATLLGMTSTRDQIRYRMVKFNMEHARRRFLRRAATERRGYQRAGRREPRHADGVGTSAP